MRTFRKEVKASKRAAIKDVSTRYHIGEMALSILYSFKGKDLIEVDEKNTLKLKILKELEEGQYVEIESFFYETYKLTENGLKLIQQVEARYQTRHGVKYGYDLFPFDAAIPELRYAV